MAFQNVAVGEPLVHPKELIALNDGGIGKSTKNSKHSLHRRDFYLRLW